MIAAEAILLAAALIGLAAIAADMRRTTRAHRWRQRRNRLEQRRRTRAGEDRAYAQTIAAAKPWATLPAPRGRATTISRIHDHHSRKVRP